RHGDVAAADQVAVRVRRPRAACAGRRLRKRATALCGRQVDDHLVLVLDVALLDDDLVRPRLARAHDVGPAAVEVERVRRAVVVDGERAATRAELGVVDRAADLDLDADHVVVGDRPGAADVGRGRLRTGCAAVALRTGEHGESGDRDKQRSNLHAGPYF